MVSTTVPRRENWPLSGPAGEARWEGPPAFIRCSGSKGTRRCGNRLCEILAIGIERNGYVNWDVAAHGFGVTDPEGHQVSRQWVSARRLGEGRLELEDLACGTTSQVDLNRVQAVYGERFQPWLKRIDIYVEDL